MMKAYSLFKACILVTIIVLVCPTVIFSQTQPIEDVHVPLSKPKYVLADGREDQKTADISGSKINIPGYYRLYGWVEMDSGEEQKNESFYVTMHYDDGTVVTPQDPNAGIYKVIEDIPHLEGFKWMDLGLFKLKEGEFILRLNHYCLIADEYPQFMHGPFETAESVSIHDSVAYYAEPVIDGAIDIKHDVTNMMNDGGVDKQTAVFGEQVIFTMTVTNVGINYIRFATAKTTLPIETIPNQFTTPPDSVSGNDYFWNIPQLEPDSTFSVDILTLLEGDLSLGFTELEASSFLTAPNDTNATNDEDMTNFWGYRDKDSVNGAIQISHNVSRTINDNGEDKVTALVGDAVTFTVQINNTLNSAIEGATTTVTFPSELTASSYSLEPANIQNGTITWNLPAIEAKGSLDISIQTLVNENISNGFSQLTTLAVLNAPNDINPNDNEDDTQFWTYNGLDGSITINHNVTRQQDNKTTAFPEENVEYTVTITNNSPIAIEPAEAKVTLPNLVEYVSDSNSATVNGQELIWSFQSFSANDVLEIKIQTKLGTGFQEGYSDLETAALLTVPDDTNPADNQASTNYYVYVPELPTFLDPDIIVDPAEIFVNIDSAQVRVEIPENTTSWDLWIHIPDGSINSTYFDNFVDANQNLTPGWYDIPRWYWQEYLYSNEKFDELEFEIRTKDIYDRDGSATALLIVRSQNNMNTDKNTYEDGDIITIKFKIKSRRRVDMNVYDVAGRHITNLTDQIYDGGWHELYWDTNVRETGKQAGSGVYLITLDAGDFKDWKKVIIVR